MKKGSKYIAPSLCDKWDDITCVTEFFAADIFHVCFFTAAGIVVTLHTSRYSFSSKRTNNAKHISMS